MLIIAKGCATLLAFACLIVSFPADADDALSSLFMFLLALLFAGLAFWLDGRTPDHDG